MDSGTDAGYEYGNALGNSGGSLVGSFALSGSNTNPQGIADPPSAMLASEKDSASAIALADAYFAAAAWKTLRPTDVETARLQWTTRERPSSDVVTNNRLWPAPSADPRTVAGVLERLERPRLRSSAADRALVDLTEQDPQ
ncbi:MAG TPA: hypothetical protein QF564_21195 [Pirellulaceae bacterium]|nr:hypothetical protein [Pirellulaceae bacterium]